VKLKKIETWNTTPNLDLSKQVNRIADIIVKDIKDGITKHSRDIHDRPFEKISQEWAKKKGHSKPLLHKGKMKEVYVKNRATKSNNTALISINKRDRTIPSKVHNEGMRPHEKREWFGVSKRAEAKADKYINLEIKRLMKK